MKKKIEIIQNPNGSYSIWDGNKLVDDGWRKLADAQSRAKRYEAASALGSAKSPAKAAASRENGKKGGRPRKTDPRYAQQETAPHLGSSAPRGRLRQPKENSTPSNR